MRHDSPAQPRLGLGAAGAMPRASRQVAAAEQPRQGVRGLRAGAACTARRPAGALLPEQGKLAGASSPFSRVRPLQQVSISPLPQKAFSCQDAHSSKPEPMHLPSTSGGSWMLLRYVLPCRMFPEEYFFPSLKTAAPGPDCVNTAKYHLIAVSTRGLYLLGNDCVANILNNSLSNVCPGYCRIHFIIRALGCTLLIILSNNLHSTVSV